MATTATTGLRVTLDHAQWALLNTLSEKLPAPSMIEVTTNGDSLHLVVLGADSRTVAISSELGSPEAFDPVYLPGSVASAGQRQAQRSADSSATLVVLDGTVEVTSVAGSASWPTIAEPVGPPTTRRKVIGSSASCDTRALFGCLIDACTPPPTIDGDGDLELTIDWERDRVTVTSHWSDGTTVRSSAPADTSGAAEVRTRPAPLAAVLDTFGYHREDPLLSPTSAETTVLGCLDSARLHVAVGGVDTLITHAPEARLGCPEWSEVLAAHGAMLVDDDRYRFPELAPPSGEQVFRITASSQRRGSHITCALALPVAADAGGDDPVTNGRPIPGTRAATQPWVGEHQHLVRAGRITDDGHRLWAETDVLEPAELTAVLARLSEDVRVLTSEHPHRRHDPSVATTNQDDPTTPIGDK